MNVFGYKKYISLPPHIWAEGILIVGDETSHNEDINSLQQFVAETLEALTVQRASLTIGDLGSEVVQLSYIDAPTAIEILRGYGVSTYSNFKK